MIAKDILDTVKQLSRADRIEFAKQLLGPEQPDREKKIDFLAALKIAGQLPNGYRQPVLQLLLEADKSIGAENLSVDDFANMAGTLLWMTQDHSGQFGLPGARIAHDFCMLANLQTVLNPGKVTA